MCHECLENAMAFHDFSVLTGGNLQATLEMVENTAPESTDLIALSTMGVFMCSRIVARSAPLGGKILIARRPITDEKFKTYERQAACFASAMQHAVDAENYAGDACEPIVSRFIEENSHEDGVKLVAAVILNYLELMLEDMERQRREAEKVVLGMLDNLLRRLEDPNLGMM